VAWHGGGHAEGGWEEVRSLAIGGADALSAARGRSGQRLRIRFVLFAPRGHRTGFGIAREQDGKLPMG
jgi:hypothetical protein